MYTDTDNMIHECYIEEEIYFYILTEFPFVYILEVEVCW
jgi:hypothetical protein